MHTIQWSTYTTYTWITWSWSSSCLKLWLHKFHRPVMKFYMCILKSIAWISKFDTLMYQYIKFDFYCTSIIIVSIRVFSAVSAMGSFWVGVAKLIPGGYGSLQGEPLPLDLLNHCTFTTTYIHISEFLGSPVLTFDLPPQGNHNLLSQILSHEHTRIKETGKAMVRDSFFWVAIEWSLSIH